MLKAVNHGDNTKQTENQCDPIWNEKRMKDIEFERDQLQWKLDLNTRTFRIEFDKYISKLECNNYAWN